MRLTDNSIYRFGQDKSGDLMALQRIANMRLCDITDDCGGSLLIYPHSFRDCKDAIGNQPLFRLDTTWNGTMCTGGSLTTGNTVGFIGIDGHDISIRSRFQKEGEEDFFLHYLLNKVLEINLFDLPCGCIDESGLDFMVYLFPGLLNAAMRRGLYKEYVSSDCNDECVRGPVDVARQLKCNYPFNGRTAYKIRRHSHDNHVTRLIRHTIEYIRTYRYGSFLLENDRETRASVSRIITATSPFVKSDRKRVILSNIKPAGNPYLTEYRPLQKLCLHILRHEKIMYGTSERKIYGILFDVAYLWEEYLATLLSPAGFHHPDNRTGTGGIYLGKDGQYPRFPDFYNKDRDGIIIDAKYKAHIDTQEDVNQMVTYMYMLRARHGVLVHPVDGGHSVRNVRLEGYGNLSDSSLKTYGFNIPMHTTGYKDFCIRMKQSESDFLTFIRSAL